MEWLLTPTSRWKLIKFWLLTPTRHLIKYTMPNWWSLLNLTSYWHWTTSPLTLVLTIWKWMNNWLLLRLYQYLIFDTNQHPNNTELFCIWLPSWLSIIIATSMHARVTEGLISPGLLCSIFYLLCFEHCLKEIPIMLNIMPIAILQLYHSLYIILLL